MNSLTIAGYIGNDAEPKYTPNGKAVTEFSVGVKVGYGKRETTQWFRCSLWGRDADHHGLTQYLNKGVFVVVSGEITVSAYQGKNGPAASADVRVLNVTLGSRDNQNSAPAASEKPSAPSNNNEDPYDDDIPF